MSAYLKALLIAERVVVDDLTEKFTLCNIADRFLVAGFPARLGQFSIYASVTDVGGEVVGTFQLLDPDMNVMKSISCPRIHVDRGDVQEFRGIFGDVVAEKAGRYTVQFLINGEVLGVTRLDVTLPVSEYFGG